MGYHKLHYRTKIHDLPISVENKKGSKRYWTDSDGTEGFTKMKVPYGYVRGTLGVDGDEVDVYIGPNKNSEKVFIITQNTKDDWNKIDEQKVMLGFDDAASAKRVYLQHLDNPKFFRNIKEITMQAFKEKLSSKKGKLIKAKASFTDEEAKKIATSLGVDFSAFSEKEWLIGINEELEHTDVTDADPVKTGKITLAHLKEDPKYYSKLKSALEKGLNDSFSSVIIVKDIIPMLILHENDMNKAFTPSAPKPGSSESTIKSDETDDDKEKTLDTLKSTCAALDDEKMDLKKKFKSKKQVKYMHAAAERGEVPKEVLSEFKEKTPKSSYSKLPEKVSSKDEKVDKGMFDINKALKAIAVSGLSRRARMDAAYKLGKVIGNMRSGGQAEPVHIDLNIGSSRPLSLHEPPAVPIRHVEPPQAAAVLVEETKSCTVHGYVHKSTSRCPLCVAAGVTEATPLWRR